MPEYLSFDDVLRQLGISEDELKRLVSEGELRAFRDKAQMRFRKEDVDSFAVGKQPGGPGVVLPGQESGEELVLPDMDAVVDFGGGVGETPSDTSVPVVDFGEGEEPAPPKGDEAAPIDMTRVPTADFGEDATIIEEPAEEEKPSEEGDTTGVTQPMVFEESEDLEVHKEDSSSVGAAEAEETFADESSSVAPEEEAAEAPEEGAEAAEGAAAVEEEEVPESPAAPARAVTAAPVVPGHHPVMSVCLLLTGVVMWTLGGLLIDLVRVTISDAAETPAESSQRIIRLVVPQGDKAAR